MTCRVADLAKQMTLSHPRMVAEQFSAELGDLVRDFPKRPQQQPADQGNSTEDDKEFVVTHCGAFVLWVP